MNLHGSATRATREDIEKLGLLNATDGVYIGGWRDPGTEEINYLLHSGSEPVLLFAPNRSGKGVSAIIPTLCQWRQSVFVYTMVPGASTLTAVQIELPFEVTRR
jgi:type IV secretion system protein VirD4